MRRSSKTFPKGPKPRCCKSLKEIEAKFKAMTVVEVALMAEHYGVMKLVVCNGRK